jgi:hypothetical protein
VCFYLFLRFILIAFWLVPLALSPYKLAFFGFVWIDDEFGGIVDVCFDKLFGKLVKWVVFFGFLSEELEFSC